MARIVLSAWLLHVSLARCNASEDAECLMQSAISVETPDSTGLLQGRVKVEVDQQDQVKPLNYYGMDAKEDGASFEEIDADKMLKDAGFGTASNEPATWFWPKDWTLKTAGNRIYSVRAMRFVPVLVLILCYLLSQYGHRDKQEKGGDLFVLMEAHDLHKIPSFWEDPFGRQDFTKERLQKALPRVTLAVAIWLVGLYCNNVCQAWLQQHMATFYDENWVANSPQKDHVLLWDMGFRFLPAFSNHSVMEFFAQGAPMLCVLRFCVFPGPLSMRWTILARMFMLWGLLWALRAMTIVATVLPNPDDTCKPSITYPSNVFMEALVNMPFDIVHHEVTCQDVLFSGHTVILTLATLMWLHYVHWAPWPEWSNAASWATIVFRFLVILNMLVGYYCIIASKFHYSADVLMGCLLTIFIFQAYHSTSWFLQSQRIQALEKFFTWFDEDAVDVAVPTIYRERKLAASDEWASYSGY